MKDAEEFGLMIAAALDAINAGEMAGNEWCSCLLGNGNILALHNDGCERTFIWNLPEPCKQRLHDEMAPSSETPRAKKQRIDKKMVAVPERSEVSERSAASEEDQASDAFEESAQEGRAKTRLLGVNAGASEASEKSVETGYLIRNHLAVNPYWKSAMNHADFCMMLGDAIDAISASENHALQWISNPCANGDVFSMHCLDAVWYLELGPQAKGNKMKGSAGRGSMGKSESGLRSRKPRMQGEAKGSHASGTGC